MEIKRNNKSNGRDDTEFSIAIDIIAQCVVAEKKDCACKEDAETCWDCWTEARDWVYSEHKDRKDEQTKNN